MKKFNLLILIASSVCCLASCGEEKQIFVDEDALKNTIAPCTSIYEIDSKQKFDNYVFNSDSLIFTVDDNLNVVDKEKKPFGTFKDIYRKFIPDEENLFPLCVRVESDASKTSLINLFKGDLKDSLDLTVISSSDAIIEDILKDDNLPYFRAAYDVSKKADFDYDTCRMRANEIGAGILLIGQNQIDVKKVRRTQNMAKCVWCYTEGETKADHYTCMASQALGVVTTDINAYNKSFNRFEYYENPVLLRPQFNIAHRGDCHGFPENSIESCEHAILHGAEALELDFHITKDDKVIVMHDKTTKRTCDKDVEIAKVTYEELKDIKIVKDFGKQDVEPASIPTLDDVVELLNKYPDVILYMETKSVEDRFPQILANEIIKHNLQNRVVIINFESLDVPLSDEIEPLPKQTFAYTKIRQVIPTLWGLDLIWSAITKIGSVEFKTTHKMGYDCNKLVGALLHPDYFDFMKNRGFIPCYWTLKDNETSYLGQVKSGVYGMTNNYAWSYGQLTKEIEVVDTIKDTSNRAEYNIKCTKYNGETYEDTGIVVAHDDNDVIMYEIYFDESNYETAFVTLVRAAI